MTFGDKKYRYRFALISGILLLFFLVLFSATVGAANISIFDALRIWFAGYLLAEDLCRQEK